jgi:hypothetical protein
MADVDCRVIALVPHPDRPEVLVSVTDDADRPRLPVATIVGTATTVAALGSIADLLGSDAPALRLETLAWRGDEEPALMLADLATIGPDAPPGYAWHRWSDTPLGDDAPDRLRTGFARWVVRREQGPRPLDPAWAAPGWFGRAASWMRERMAALGHPPDGPTRIVHLWGLAIVLETPAAAGAMYLKSVPAVFRQEAALTAVIAEATPDRVVRVADVEPVEGWLLMHDFGGRRVGDGPPETWAPALAVHATIQQSWADRTHELVAAGAPVRPLRDLASALPTLADAEVLAEELTGDDLRAWRAVMPRFVDACRRLDDLGPPPTLVHGDLHPWNVADTPDGPRLFDWTDAAVSHPFIDLAVYATRPDDPALRHAVREAYLAAWAGRMPAADLREAGELAIVVGTLYSVAGYVRLFASLERDDREDLDGAAGSWARAAIDALDDGLDMRRRGHADG